MPLSLASLVCHDWLVDDPAQFRRSFRGSFLRALGSLSRCLPPSRTKNRLGRLIAYLLGDPAAVLGAIGDVRLWLRPADRTASEAFWSGQYEDTVTSLLVALLSPGMTIVDAGANVGMLGLRLGARLRTLGSGRVMLFEPVPANVQLLKASIRANALEPFCDVYAIGLSDSVGTATLLVEAKGRRSGNAGLFEPEHQRRHVTPTLIPLRTLDEVLGDIGDPPVHLMKLDVEGGELALLRGAGLTIARTRPLIFGEFHPGLLPRRGGTIVDIVELLAPYGYHAFAIRGLRTLVEVTPEPGRGDLLFAVPEKLAHALHRCGRGWTIDEPLRIA